MTVRGRLQSNRIAQSSGYQNSSTTFDSSPDVGHSSRTMSRKVSSTYKDLKLSSNSNWVLLDPANLPKDLPFRYLPELTERFARYKPGNKRILEFNTFSKAIRFISTPDVLINKRVEYTQDGPRLVDLADSEHDESASDEAEQEISRPVMKKEKATLVPRPNNREDTRASGRITRASLKINKIEKASELIDETTEEMPLTPLVKRDSSEESLSIVSKRLPTQAESTVAEAQYDERAKVVSGAGHALALQDNQVSLKREDCSQTSLRERDDEAKSTESAVTEPEEVPAKRRRGRPRKYLRDDGHDYM